MKLHRNGPVTAQLSDSRQLNRPNNEDVVKRLAHSNLELDGDFLLTETTRASAFY